MNHNNSSIEGLEVIATKRTEIDKEDFFKMLAKHEELTLSINRIGKVGKSKYPNKNGIYPYGCFIDYTFTADKTDYEIGIYYNIGEPLAEGKYKATSGMYTFKLLEVFIDLSEYEEVAVTEELIRNTLTGKVFKATLGTSKNGFYVKPVEVLEG